MKSLLLAIMLNGTQIQIPVQSYDLCNQLRADMITQNPDEFKSIECQDMWLNERFIKIQKLLLNHK